MESVCGICLENIGDSKQTTGCAKGHLLHTACYKEWKAKRPAARDICIYGCNQLYEAAIDIPQPAAEEAILQEAPPQPPQDCIDRYIAFGRRCRQSNCCKAIGWFCIKLVHCLLFLILILLACIWDLLCAILYVLIGIIIFAFCLCALLVSLVCSLPVLFYASCSVLLCCERSCWDEYICPPGSSCSFAHLNCYDLYFRLENCQVVQLINNWRQYV